jgi:hypothetical protein
MQQGVKFPRLFVFDLEGTALSGERLADPFTQFLDRLHERGCRWSINAGKGDATWSLVELWRLVQDSAVRSRPVYLMGELGHRLGEIQNDQPVRVEPYSREVEREVADARVKYLFPVMRDLCGYFRHENIGFSGHLLFMRVVETQKAEFHARLLEWRGRCPELRFEIAEDGSMVALPKGLSKGRSLREVLRLAKLGAEDVVVAGDAREDLEMMHPSLAQHLICPVNAALEVQRHVRESKGEIGAGQCSEGVMQAFGALAGRRGWDW